MVVFSKVNLLIFILLGWFSQSSPTKGLCLSAVCYYNKILEMIILKREDLFGLQSWRLETMVSYPHCFWDHFMVEACGSRDCSLMVTRKQTQKKENKSTIFPSQVLPSTRPRLLKAPLPPICVTGCQPNLQYMGLWGTFIHIIARMCFLGDISLWYDVLKARESGLTPFLSVSLVMGSPVYMSALASWYFIHQQILNTRHQFSVLDLQGTIVKNVPR